MWWNSTHKRWNFGPRLPLCFFFFPHLISVLGQCKLINYSFAWSYQFQTETHWEADSVDNTFLSLGANYVHAVLQCMQTVNEQKKFTGHFLLNRCCSSLWLHWLVLGKKNKTKPMNIHIFILWVVVLPVVGRCFNVSSVWIQPPDSFSC